MTLEQQTAPAPHHLPEISRRDALKLLGGLTVTGTVTYALSRSGILGSAFEQLAKRGEVPQTFDNKATNGVIGDNNTVKASLAEIQQQFPEPFVEKANTVSSFFPFQLPEGRQAPYGKTQSVYEQALLNTLPPEAKAEAAKKGVVDKVNFTLPKDTIILAAFDSHILTMSEKRTSGGQNSADGARLFYYDKATDKTYIIWFSSPNPDAFNSFVPVQGIEPTLWRGTSWEQLPTIEQGTPILKTTKDNQSVSLNIRVAKGKIVGPQADLVDKTSYAVTPQFLTTATPEGQKILVLGK